jgi:RimJ/RimL family protein N-acetyltransferase
MPDHFVDLRSPRLTLRRLRPGDGPAIVAYRALPEVARYQSWESFTPGDAERLIASKADAQPGVPGTWFQLAITLADGGELIGDCGLHGLSGAPRQMEIGITLAPAHQRQGYAAEALCLVLAYLFDALQTHRVTAVTDAENHAAARLLRSVGFRQEGHFVENVWFKGAWGSEFSFALLRSEWSEIRSASRPLAGE